jgi:hypothetical protein
MTPPTVLLDRSFLEALIDAEHEHHAIARDSYERLLDEYEANRIRVRARADHLATVDGATSGEVLAPVETIHVARQYRRQAHRLAGGYEPDVAVTMVVMRRESIDRIATFLPFFHTIDVTVEI